MFQCIVDTAQFLFRFHCVRELQFVFAKSDSRTAPGRQKNPNAIFLFRFRFSFYSLLLFVYFNYAAAFGNACLYGLRSDFGLMLRVQPFRKPDDMLIQCKNRKAGTSARRIQAQAASPPHRLTPHGGISLPCIPRDPPQGSSDTNPPWSNRCTAQW